jgi:hypothetical protein
LTAGDCGAAERGGNATVSSRGGVPAASTERRLEIGDSCAAEGAEVDVSAAGEVCAGTGSSTWREGEEEAEEMGDGIRGVLMQPEGAARRGGAAFRPSWVERRSGAVLPVLQWAPTRARGHDHERPGEHRAEARSAARLGEEGLRIRDSADEPDGPGSASQKIRGGIADLPLSLW